MGPVSSTESPVGPSSPPPPPPEPPPPGPPRPPPRPESGRRGARGSSSERASSPSEGGPPSGPAAPVGAPPSLSPWRRGRAARPPSACGAGRREAGQATAATHASARASKYETWGPWGELTKRAGGAPGMRAARRNAATRVSQTSSGWGADMWEGWSDSQTWASCGSRERAETSSAAGVGAGTLARAAASGLEVCPRLAGGPIGRPAAWLSRRRVGANRRGGEAPTRRVLGGGAEEGRAEGRALAGARSTRWRLAACRRSEYSRASKARGSSLGGSVGGTTRSA